MPCNVRRTAASHPTLIQGNLARMAQHVTETPIGVVWNPNSEHAVLVTTEMGETRLRLRARSDDPDQRTVVIAWHGSLAARMEPPNDEARSGHRHHAGLSGVLWMGEVHESELIADFERQNRVHPGHKASMFEGYRHWVLPLKGSVVEVVAESFEVGRAAPRSEGPRTD